MFALYQTTNWHIGNVFVMYIQYFLFFTFVILASLHLPFPSITSSLSPPFTFPSLPSLFHFNSLCDSYWLCVCEKKRERGVERPAKLEQSSPWWYFYPGQQAPPGVYITYTHTLPHTLFISLSLWYCFVSSLTFLPLSLFFILSFSQTHHRHEGRRALSCWLACS